MSGTRSATSSRRQRRQAHELDEVAAVLAVGAQRQPAHAWIVRWQAQDVAEVAVRPAPLGRPQQVRRLREVADHRARQDRRHACEQPRGRRGSPGPPMRSTTRELAPPRRCGASSRRPAGARCRRPAWAVGHFAEAVATLAFVPASFAERPLGRRLGPDQRLVVVAADERLDAVERDVVVDLLRRALHEVARRRDERALQPAIEAELQAADGVGDDAGAVGAVPDLELELGVERHVAVGRALHPDVAPLAVEQPRHVVARADVDVVGVDLVVEHRGDGVRLGDLLGLEALALEHVEEVGVAAEVELVGPVEADAAVHEQAGQHAVADRRADLALDVVADDRQAAPRRSGAASTARGR